MERPPELAEELWRGVLLAKDGPSGAIRFALMHLEKGAPLCDALASALLVVNMRYEQLLADVGVEVEPIDESFARALEDIRNKRHLT